ncbi:TetR/AcrR family transcriptional regulator [Microbacterium sp. A94]|uniref:TetR/AcrR family transcriptional regulator n=1 Tax=Microbacterium sp. A94 TaxID=3450717 RepID=UPI003F41DFDA
MMAQEPGRRERKKRETENAIEEAAISLALERGHAAITVPDICERADVSRSTFFNYAASREAAIFGRPLNLLPHDQALDLLMADTSARNTTALFMVVLASLPHAQVNPVVAAGRARLLAEQPDTQATLFAQFGPISTQLTAVAEHWLLSLPSRRVIPDDTAAREATLTVSMVMGAFMAVVSEASGPTDVTLSIPAFEKAIADIRRLTAR